MSFSCNPCENHQPADKTCTCSFCFQTICWSSLQFTNWFSLCGPSHHLHTPVSNHLDSNFWFLLVTSTYLYSKIYAQKSLSSRKIIFTLKAKQNNLVLLTEDHYDASHIVMSLSISSFIKELKLYKSNLNYQRCKLNKLLGCVPVGSC